MNPDNHLTFRPNVKEKHRKTVAMTDDVLRQAQWTQWLTGNLGTMAGILTVGPHLLESLRICLWKTKTRAPRSRLDIACFIPNKIPA